MGAGHEHNHEHSHEHGSSGVEVHVGHKVGALVLMGVLTLISSLAPIYIRKKLFKKSSSKSREMVLSGLLCFGAGVLLASVFLHLLPETRHNISHAMEDGFITKTDFPIAELLVCCGFFLIYLIEDMVHTCVGHSKDNEDIKSDSTVPMTNIKTGEGGKDKQNSASAKVNDKSTANGIDNKAFQGDLDQVSSHHHHGSTHNNNSSQPTLMKGEDTSIVNAVLVTIAISVHSVMEGLAIGLEEHVMDMWLLWGSITLHKLIIAFSIGMELLQEGVKHVPFLVAMIIFSLASPIGVAIGCATLSMKEETALGIMVPEALQGLSGGCILFIIFCEIIERERTRPNGTFIRIVALILGFGLMCGLKFIPGHSH